MENTQFKGKSVMKWAVSVGIIIVLNLFFAVAIQTLYPRPEFDDFCKVRQVNQAYEDEASCVAAGGQWNPNIHPASLDAFREEQAKPTAPTPTGYCNPDFTCAQTYQDASKDYARNVFTTLIVLGALSIAAGFALRMSPAVSAGLSYGGVLAFVIAAIRYWDAAGDLVRLAIVGAALVALIAIGVKKFKE